MSENRELAVLETALELIHDPECWIKNTEAMTADNRVISAYDPKATKFCMLGAIAAAYRMRRYRTPSVKEGVQKLIEELLPFDTWESIDEFNDAEDTTHEDVVLMFKRAILYVEEGL